MLFIGTHRSRKPKKKGKTGRTATPYPFKFRLKVVKLHLEDGYPAAMSAQQFGISNYTVYRWIINRREQGERGLRNKVRKPAGRRVKPAVTQRIVTVKKEIPGYSVMLLL